MNFRKTGGLLLTALSGVLLGGLIASQSLAEETPDLRAFKTTDVYGAAVDLGQLADQWVVVNFWATWCKPCRKEIPDFSALHDRREDVSLVGLAFEETTPEAIQAFLKDFPASYPMALVDVFDPPAGFGTPRVLPTTLLISPEGELTRRFVGPVTSADIEAEIDAAGG